MSFDVNPLNNTPHQIRASKSQDGGAGNTGYFQQGKNKKEEDENSLNKSVFKEKKRYIFFRRCKRGFLF